MAMRLTTLIGIALGAACISAAPTQASYDKATAQHHHASHHSLIGKEYAELQRTCSWVGPGARAVYRCSVLDVKPVVDEVPHKRVCGWVGPQAPPRSVYACW
jgi:hypothetical protein